MKNSLRRALSRLWILANGVSGGAGDWVPSTDLALQSFANNFAAVLTVDYATYGISSGDAVAFQSLADDYSDAYDVANADGTRTPASIAAKDAAKNAMKPEMRRIGNLIQANPSITDEQKITLGLTVRDVGPGSQTDVPAPSTFPLLSILNATPFNHNLIVVDSATPDTNAKPPGAIALEFRCKVSATAIVDPEEIPYVGLETEHLINRQFEAGDVGKQAYYTGRWITRRGLVGPWADIQSMTVAA